MNKANLTESSAGLRVLVVEDHADSANAIGRLLRADGHWPAIAHDLRTARSLVASQGFDLLISDLSLPDGSGLELMRHLQNVGSIRGIALSGFNSDIDERESHNAGFSAHLAKPIDFARLRETIVRVLTL